MSEKLDESVNSVGYLEDVISAFKNISCLEEHIDIRMKEIESRSFSMSEEESNQLAILSILSVYTRNVRRSLMLFISDTKMNEIENQEEILGGLNDFDFSAFSKSTKETRLKIWCMVKHISTAEKQLSESVQASDNAFLYSISKVVKQIETIILSYFMGFEVKPCFACLQDSFMKGGTK